ncbi:MAG TPA: sterol desaturase family protein [Anaerolineales bacterium]|nr:sterol desaturase family protein [Anaerolineales bacterium]
MSHLPIDPQRDTVPIRLFESEFLEFFTHIHPMTIVALWLPIAVLLIVYAGMNVPGSGFPVFIPLGFLIGLFLWTLAEYTLHRFLFHYKPTSPRQERILFLFHGIHHAQPQVKTRLVMPFPVSIPGAAIFFGLFYLSLAVVLKSPQWVAPLMSGFLIGYLAYDLTHYATHHFPMRSGYAKYIKRYHMQHHYKDPDTRFGVSSPIWDWVFRTQGIE